MKDFLEGIIKGNPGFSGYLDEALRRDKIIVSRIVIIAGMILYGLFSVVDYYSLEENSTIIFLIRYIIIFYLLIALLTTYKKAFFVKNYGIITASYFWVGGLGIELMMFLVNKNELAFYTYFAGLMLLIFACFTWGYLNSTVSLFLALFFILTYIGIFYFSDSGINDFKLPILINHVAFLISTVAIGLLADILLKQNLYRQYRMQSRLRELLLTNGALPLTRENQNILESLPNFHQYKNQLSQQMSDAEYCNLLLSVNCLQLVNEDITILNNNQFKTMSWDKVIISSLDDILPDSTIIALLDNNKLYFSYLLKNKDSEEIDNRTNLIMTFLEKEVNQKMGAKKIIPCIGSTSVFQNKTNAELLIDTCDKNLLSYLDKKRESVMQRPRVMTNSNITSFEKFVKKPTNSDASQT